LEHALEFEPREAGLQGIELRIHFGKSGAVILGSGQFRELAKFVQAPLQVAQDGDDLGEFSSLLGQALRLLPIRPNGGFGQFKFNLIKPFLPMVKVKDTPEGPLNDRSNA